MKSPYDLATELNKIVAKACDCEVAWSQHEGPVTAHELATIYAETQAYLLAERERAIAEEHGPLSEEDEFVG